MFSQYQKFTTATLAVATRLGPRYEPRNKGLNTRHKRRANKQSMGRCSPNLSHCSYMLPLKHLPLRKARYHHTERQRLLVIAGLFVNFSKMKSSGDHYRNDPVQVQSRSDLTSVKHERCAATACAYFSKSCSERALAKRATNAKLIRPKRWLCKTGGGATTPHIDTTK